MLHHYQYFYTYYQTDTIAVTIVCMAERKNCDLNIVFLD